METITVNQVGPIITVMLDRPDHHNALTPIAVAELTEVFRRLAVLSDGRVVILTGSGRSFCAGADLAFMRAAADFSFAENVADGEAIFDLMLAIDSCPLPVIGRVNGAAIGGGCGLVACCDSVVAVERAHFAFSEVRLGIVPAVISPFVLAKIGASHARELFLTGERFDAGRAHQIGLVHHVVAGEADLNRAVAERAEHFLQGAPGAISAAKALVRHSSTTDLSALRRTTTELIARRRASEEGREGMSAFLEKRKPRW